ncbi:hypothetical protein AB0H43_02280 [Hamadaea sp. NPDC050747]|uniref:hypothetical protein n=1 Tax=Hamadaea sp. NPDC050747 TaxID=3155789 RepID=UPI0033D55F6E
MTMRGIAIDLQAVTDLFTKLSSDVDVGLVPDGERAALGVGCGARFGTGFAALDVQGHVKASNVAFSGAISRYVGNLHAHVANARALLASVEQVLKNYRSADGVAAALATATMSRSGEYSDEATAASATALADGVTSSLTPPPLPSATVLESSEIAWGKAFDVQRMKDILFRDNLGEAWSQVSALRLLGQALENHYRRILELRPKLASIWPAGASITAAEAQTKLDDHAKAVWQDALCAQTTAKTLDGIVSAITTARTKIAPIHDRWQTVTVDFVPNDWNPAAMALNKQGRQVMKELDATVADLRTQIYWPNEAWVDRSGPDGTRVISGASESNPSSAPERRASARRHAGGLRPVPPAPGVNPAEGPGLASGTTPIGVSPGTPPSTLPVPPGLISEAPFGGAWVLPSSSTSAYGRLLPIRGNTYTTPGMANANVGSRVPGVSGTNPSGMMGVPMSGYGGGAAAPGAISRQRMATEQWEVEEGVPPVIGETGPFFLEEDEEVDDEQRIREDFEDWYNRYMLPWNEGPQ